MQKPGQGLPVGHQLQVLPGDHPQGHDQNEVHQRRRSHRYEGAQALLRVAAGEGPAEQAVDRPGRAPHGGGGQQGLEKDGGIVGLALQKAVDDAQVQRSDEGVAHHGADGGMYSIR